MKKLYFLITTLFISMLTLAQEKEALTAKRADNKIVFNDNTVKIFPGGRIFLSASNKSGSLKGFKVEDTASSKITDLSHLSEYIQKQGAEKMICIDFAVLNVGPGQNLSILIVNNPFDRAMKYYAQANIAKKGGYSEMYINPVKPGAAGMETFPFPASEVVIYNFSVDE